MLSLDGAVGSWLLHCLHGFLILSGFSKVVTLVPRAFPSSATFDTSIHSLSSFAGRLGEHAAALAAPLRQSPGGRARQANTQSYRQVVASLPLVLGLPYHSFYHLFEIITCNVATSTAQIVYFWSAASTHGNPELASRKCIATFGISATGYNSSPHSPRLWLKSCQTYQSFGPGLLQGKLSPIVYSHTTLPRGVMSSLLR